MRRNYTFFCYNCFTTKRARLGMSPTCNCGLKMFYLFRKIKEERDKKDFIGHYINSIHNTLNSIPYKLLHNDIKVIIAKDVKKFFPNFKVYELEYDVNFFNLERAEHKPMPLPIYKISFYSNKYNKRQDYFYEGETLNQAKKRFIESDFNKNGVIQMVEEIHNYYFKEVKSGQ